MARAAALLLLLSGCAPSTARVEPDPPVAARGREEGPPSDVAEEAAAESSPGSLGRVEAEAAPAARPVRRDRPPAGEGRSAFEVRSHWVRMTHRDSEPEQVSWTARGILRCVAEATGAFRVEIEEIAGEGVDAGALRGAIYRGAIREDGGLVDLRFFPRRPSLPPRAEDVAAELHDLVRRGLEVRPSEGPVEVGEAWTGEDEQTLQRSAGLLRLRTARTHTLLRRDGATWSALTTEATRPVDGPPQIVAHTSDMTYEQDFRRDDLLLDVRLERRGFVHLVAGERFSRSEHQIHSSLRPAPDGARD